MCRFCYMVSASKHYLYNSPTLEEHAAQFANLKYPPQGRTLDCIWIFVEFSMKLY